MPRAQSEAIQEVRYDRERGWLFVRFSSGAWYAYLEVAPALYDAFISADSKGRFFQDQVRDRYRYVRIDAPAQR